MNNKFSILIIFLITLFIAGCSSVPIPKVTKYSLDTPAADSKEIKTINISVKRVRGRYQYDKNSIFVSPEPHIVDTYKTAQWVENPCSMLTDDTIAYLSKQFKYVTSSSLNYNDSINYVISIYIDDLKHIKRDNKWFAVLKLHCEIASPKAKKVVCNFWFRENVELPDSSIQTYINVQNESVSKFMQLLSSEISKFSP